MVPDIKNYTSENQIGGSLVRKNGGKQIWNVVPGDNKSLYMIHVHK